jgi:methionyl-tRNA formyltransferase
MLGGRKLFIWQATIAVEAAQLGEAGEIIAEHAGGAIEVAAGAGSVLLLRAQFEEGAEGQARSVLGADLLQGSIVIV